MNDDDLATLQQFIKERADLDEELGKFQRMVAVMVIDLMGATAYFDRCGDIAGFVRLHIFTDMVIPIAEQHGGTIAKVMGDTVLAHFEDPAQSVRATARMFSVLQERSARKGKAPRDYGDDMHARAALNWGLGLVKDQDVFGDVVNMAFRINRLAKSDQILTSATMAEKLRGAQVPIRELGSRQIKGRSEAVAICEVLWREIQ